jgi:hypothetical protein
MKIKIGSIVLLKELKNEHKYYFGWNNSIRQYYRKVGIVDQLTSSYEHPGARVVFKTPHCTDKFTFLVTDLIVLDHIKYVL